MEYVRFYTPQWGEAGVGIDKMRGETAGRGMELNTLHFVWEEIF